VIVAASRKPAVRSDIELVLDAPDASVLDVLDHLLNKGVMLNADVTLGVAGIDLIYLRLSSLLCAADRVLPHAPLRERVAGRSRRRPKRRA
jgi:gas vesicle protein GvpA/GvpJ/GvpM family